MIRTSWSPAVGEGGDSRSHSWLDEGDVTERGGEIGGDQGRVPDGLHVTEHPAAAACDHGARGEFQGAVGMQRVEGAYQVLLFPGEDAAQGGAVTGLPLPVGDALVGNGQSAARLAGGAGTQVLGVGEARHGEQLVEILGVRLGRPQELGGAPGQCGGEVRSKYGVQAGGPGPQCAAARSNSRSTGSGVRTDIKTSLHAVNSTAATRDFFPEYHLLADTLI